MSPQNKEQTYDMIIDFSIRKNKRHNCHMSKGKKNLWKVENNDLECYGSKLIERT
jgi:hypothetical protein